MAMPPSGFDLPDGDTKRLTQRADTFSLGNRLREKREFDDFEELEDAFDSVLGEVKKLEAEPEEDQEKALEEHREEHAQKEANRRGSSSPSPLPFLGLSVLPGINSPSLVIGRASEGHRQEGSKGVDSKDEVRVETVSFELVSGLKKAGLSEPLVSLDDPRVNGPLERLNRHFVLSLNGTDRVHVWDQNRCHQILTVGLHETKLESAVGETIEVVTRRGRTDEKTVKKRDSHSADFSLGSTDV